MSLSLAYFDIQICVSHRASTFDVIKFGVVGNDTPLPNKNSEIFIKLTYMCDGHMVLAVIEVTCTDVQKSSSYKDSDFGSILTSPCRAFMLETQKQH